MHKSLQGYVKEDMQKSVYVKVYVLNLCTKMCESVCVNVYG
jgi:hypothetical protein